MVTLAENSPTVKPVGRVLTGHEHVERIGGGHWIPLVLNRSGRECCVDVLVYVRPCNFSGDINAEYAEHEWRTPVAAADESLSSFEIHLAENAAKELFVDTQAQHDREQAEREAMARVHFKAGENPGAVARLIELIEQINDEIGARARSRTGGVILTDKALTSEGMECRLQSISELVDKALALVDRVEPARELVGAA